MFKLTFCDALNEDYFLQADDSIQTSENHTGGLLYSLAIGVSLLIHFFLALFLSAQFFAEYSKVGEEAKVVLHLELVERTPEIKTVEIEMQPLTTHPPITPALKQASQKSESQPLSESLPAPASSQKADNAGEELSANTERIFDPQLRQALENMKNGSSETGFFGQTNVHGSQYFELSGGKCLRENLGGYGITDRNSEEFLMLNVRKISCPGEAAESEGEAMLRGLRAALAEKRLKP